MKLSGGAPLIVTRQFTKCLFCLYVQGAASITQMHKILTAHSSKTRLLISSVRDPADVAAMAAQVGGRTLLGLMRVCQWTPLGSWLDLVLMSHDCMALYLALYGKFFVCLFLGSQIN